MCNKDCSVISLTKQEVCIISYHKSLSRISLFNHEAWIISCNKHLIMAHEVGTVPYYRAITGGRLVRCGLPEVLSLLPIWSSVRSHFPLHVYSILVGALSNLVSLVAPSQKSTDLPISRGLVGTLYNKGLLAVSTSNCRASIVYTKQHKASTDTLINSIHPSLWPLCCDGTNCPINKIKFYFN